MNAAGVAWSGNAFTGAAGSSYLGEGTGYSGDSGPAQQARFGGGQSVFAPNGDLYFIDGNCIRKLNWPTTPAPAPSISHGGIVNALSYAGGGVSAGELVSILGTNFSTTNLQVSSAQNNVLPPVLGRTKVLFVSGFYTYEAPITALTPNQINVFVPWLAVRDPSNPPSMFVQVDDQFSPRVAVTIAQAAPSLATADSSGSGQGTILNQDGSINSSAAPAARGSIISLFGTGAGLAAPQLPDGALVISMPYPAPQNSITVTIGGQPAQVLYAGAAPFEANGVLHINAVIPTGVQPGNVPVSISAGTTSSAQSVTVSVR